MMPRGRKPTPVQLRVLQGNPRRRPIPNTPDPVSTSVHKFSITTG
jgi:hypothetical protein